MKPFRHVLALALVGALVVAGSAGAATRKPTLKLGPNLVVNPSFEDSTVDAATANGIPVLPVGWSFEGATILFDYNQQVGHTGKRNAGISGSLAPGRQVCDGSSGAFVCAPNPASAVTGQASDATLKTSSLRPFWITKAAIPVKQGKAFRMAMYSLWASLDPVPSMYGEGAATKLRWLDASGAALSVTDGPSSLLSAKKHIGFQYSTTDVVVPQGAAGVQLMLGFTDITTTSGRVLYDDISFQEILHR